MPDCRCQIDVGAPISTGKLRTSLSRTAKPALHLPTACAGAQFVTDIIVLCAQQTYFISAALGELKHGLRDALMLELAPGEAFYQESSVVLLRGKLLMTGRADTVPLQQLPGELLALVTVLMLTAAQLHRQNDEDDRHQRQASGDWLG